ncbi:beta-glucosidase BglX [Rosenbergiella nectarea]|uniref:beta-glucosidase BglX n=1 Tax=Rosenbergiella nectarea TaxID=988801 RepID=UPI001BDAF216|nr:beta-glucosidase BglX [Rosenbergiella nectarea]MBT0730721.1 beta-glucosidase BglX [Rosenbergiella nectarea subsp. apis]
MKSMFSLAVILPLAFFSAPLFAEPAPLQASNETQRDHFVSALLKKMTLDEKIGQLRLISVGPETPKQTIKQMIEKGQVGAIFNTVTRPDIRVMQDQVMQLSRLKIPLFFAYDVVHGQRTIFPIPLGLAASWDTQAIATVGRISALEAAQDGLNMTWAPMVDVSHEPRWGRSSEGFGEDTYLTSIMGKTMVEAMQGPNPADRNAVMTSVKHFALYGAVEGGREYNSVDMSPQQMFQHYLPPYQAALQAGSGGVMVSLNSINGVPATANRWLLTDLLRHQWHFKGITISDHGAIKELINHGVASDPADAVRVAIKAGIDMSMSDQYYSQYLPGLVKSGAVSVAEVDNAARHVLNVKYDMGLFRDAYSHLGPAGSDPQDTNAEDRLHRAQAREVAAQSLVLLKNWQQILPLKKQGTIALIGPLADSQRDIMGSWSAAGVAKQSVTLLQGMREAVANKATLLYAKGSNITDNTKVQAFLNLYEPAVDVDKRSPQQLRDEAIATAKKADVVVMAVGESQGMAHEASSRSDIRLPKAQRDLITAIKATGKPLVLVLMNGRALDITQQDQQADGILETWFSGTEGGHAISDVLFGDVNPSGKLPVTFPRSVGQLPLYYNHLPTGRPYDFTHPNKYTSHYFDINNSPLYPFGFGLSYTEFTLSPITLSSAGSAEGVKMASVTVTNSGKRAGGTIVQLYLHDPVASISRPIKELKAFQKVQLQPGESKKVTFTLSKNDLGFWNQQMKWEVEPGEFVVMIGTDSVHTAAKSFTYP